MPSIKIEEDIKVEVDNNGMVTFSAIDGRFCFICIHPVDTSKLVKFLVSEGYRFQQ